MFVVTIEISAAHINNNLCTTVLESNRSDRKLLMLRLQDQVLYQTVSSVFNKSILAVVLRKKHAYVLDIELIINRNECIVIRLGAFEQKLFSRRKLA